MSASAQERQQKVSLHRSPKPDLHPHASNHRHRWRSSRRGTRRVVGVAVVLVVAVHTGLVVMFHLSLLQFLQEDVYATVASQYPWLLSTDPIHNASNANETVANSSVVVRPLPPPPWPARRDGCAAEDGMRPYCRFHNLLVDFSRISSTAIGGEPLFPSVDDMNQSRAVMGQSEADEYLVYQPGAFRILAERKKLPIVQYNNPVSFHYVNDVLGSLQVINVPNVSGITIKDQNCTSYYYGTTLFLQRYEYVNLYHTLTDWWNTWTVYRHVQERELAHFPLVFLDAHPEGSLDPVWETLFGRSMHLRRLDDDNIHPRQQERMCFQRALFVPPGYISHLWPQEPPNGGVGDNRTYEMMNPFVDFVLDKLRLSHVQRIPGRVVIIDRKPYVAHPRSRIAEDRSLSNLADVATTIMEKVPNITSVRIVALHNMTFREQVQAIREAEVLMGNHGAGLSHLVFMDDDSHVIEFEMNFLTFFNHLSACKQGRVTLHQLPDVRGSISTAYFENALLPAFFRIYGMEPPPLPETSGDRLMVDRPILSDAIQQIDSNENQTQDGADEVKRDQMESKVPQEPKEVDNSPLKRSNPEPVDIDVLPKAVQSRLRDRLDHLAANQQVEGQPNATRSVAHPSTSDGATNRTASNATQSVVSPLDDPHRVTRNHRNATHAHRSRHPTHDRNNHTSVHVALDSHHTNGSTRVANHSPGANHSVAKVVKGNSSTARNDHRPTRVTENRTNTSVVQIPAHKMKIETKDTKSTSLKRINSTETFVNGSRLDGKSDPLRHGEALGNGTTKVNGAVPMNETVDVPLEISVAHLSTRNRTANVTHSDPALEAVQGHSRTDLTHRNTTNETMHSLPSSVGRLSPRIRSSKAVNATPAHGDSSTS